MTISAPAAAPEPRGAKRKAVGLLLAPGPGRLAALAIAGVPLLIFLLIGFRTASSDGGAPSYGYTGGGQPPGQVQLPYVGNSAQAYDGSGQTSDTASATPADQSTDQPTDQATDQATATDSPSPGVSDSSSDGSGASGSAAPSPTASGPAGTVLAAYAAANRHDYQTAYNLGLGKDSGSFSAFVQNYGQYSDIAIVIESVAGDEVYASLTLTYTDGNTRAATGTYVVSGGVITAEQVE